MHYVHGHAACVAQGCPMRHVNQAECCDGETAAQCPLPTSAVAAVPLPHSRGDGADRPSGSRSSAESSKPRMLRSSSLPNSRTKLSS